MEYPFLQTNIKHTNVISGGKHSTDYIGRYKCIKMPTIEYWSTLIKYKYECV